MDECLNQVERCVRQVFTLRTSLSGLMTHPTSEWEEKGSVLSVRATLPQHSQRALVSSSDTSLTSH